MPWYKSHRSGVKLTQNFSLPSLRAKQQPVKRSNNARSQPMPVRAPHLETNRSPQFHQCGNVFLKYNQTKRVKLRMSDTDELKLVAEDLPHGSLSGNGDVQIWKWNNYIALCLKYRRDYYLVTVDETGLLKLKKTTGDQQQIQTLTTCFVKHNSSGVTGQYLLQTANLQDPSSPSKYLVIDDDSRSITLSDHQPLDASSNSLTCSLSCPVTGCTGL